MCPNELLDDKFVWFLRRELMDPTKAATHTVLHWQRRQETFGPDKWHLPMAQDGALRDDRTALQKRGKFHVVPHLDAVGRPVVSDAPSCGAGTGCTTQSVMRTTWCMAESLLQHCTNACDHGVVMTVCQCNAKPFEHFDRKGSKAFVDFENTTCRQNQHADIFVVLHCCLTKLLNQFCSS